MSTLGDIETAIDVLLSRGCKKSRIKVIKAIEIDKAGLPGEIIEENFTVACSSNAIKILELQKEGKNKMKTFEFLKGNSLTVGDQIK